jgi:putative transposase
MPKAPSVYRASVVPHFANRAKQATLRTLFRARRRCAAAQAASEWRYLYAGGRLEPMRADRAGFAHVTGTQGQMVRAQVCGAIDSWLSNRQNEVRDLVTRSSLPADRKHRLHTLNSLKAWYWPTSVTVLMRSGPEKGQPIPAEDRALLRALMRHLRRTHRRPSFNRLNIVMDSRGATVEAPKTATHHAQWLSVSTLTRGARVQIPLGTYDYLEGREGARANTIQINETRDGAMQVVFLYDQTAACQTSRAAYAERVATARAAGLGLPSLSLDLGLRFLFGTNAGDLVGRGWGDRLTYYDARLTRLAAYRQQHGLKVRSPRYDRYVRAMAGMITSEINRVLNRLVAVHTPETLVLETLNFRASGLSRRMNRLLSRIGQRAIAAKRQDLQERYGIAVIEVPAAYSSQECHKCQYVDPRNRDGERVRCFWCGQQSHADVNAPKVTDQRRSLVTQTTGPVTTRAQRDAFLGERVRAFTERFPFERTQAPPSVPWGRTSGRAQGRPPDPRLSNPYFRAARPAPRMSGAAPCVTS